MVYAIFLAHPDKMAEVLEVVLDNSLWSIIQHNDFTSHSYEHQAIYITIKQNIAYQKSMNIDWNSRHKVAWHKYAIALKKVMFMFVVKCVFDFCVHDHLTSTTTT